MSGIKIVVLVYLAVSALLYVSKTGKEREPVSAVEAVGYLIEVGIIAWLVVIS